MLKVYELISLYSETHAKELEDAKESQVFAHWNIHEPLVSFYCAGSKPLLCCDPLIQSSVCLVRVHEINQKAIFSSLALSFEEFLEV